MTNLEFQSLRVSNIAIIIKKNKKIVKTFPSLFFCFAWRQQRNLSRLLSFSESFFRRQFQKKCKTSQQTGRFNHAFRSYQSLFNKDLRPEVSFLNRKDLRRQPGFDPIIPSPSHPVKNQIMGGKVSLSCKGKTLFSKVC